MTQISWSRPNGCAYCKPGGVAEGLSQAVRSRKPLREQVGDRQVGILPTRPPHNCDPDAGERTCGSSRRYSDTRACRQPKSTPGSQSESSAKFTQRSIQAPFRAATVSRRNQRRSGGDAGVAPAFLSKAAPSAVLTYRCNKQPFSQNSRSFIFRRPAERPLTTRG